MPVTSKERNISEALTTAAEARVLAKSAIAAATDARREAKEALREAVIARKIIDAERQEKRKRQASRYRTSPSARPKQLHRRTTRQAKRANTSATKTRKQQNPREHKQKPGLLARILFGTPKTRKISGT